MKMRLVWLLLALPLTAWAGTSEQFTITVGPRLLPALDRSVAPGGSHQGQTKQQVLQAWANDDLRALQAQQAAEDTQAFEDKYALATPASQQNAQAALNAGITVPVITDIPDQVHNVAQPVLVPVVAVNPYPLERGLSYNATGLPPGVTLGFDATGNAQLVGTLTTAGTFAVTVEAWNFPDVKGTETFTWTANP